MSLAQYAGVLAGRAAGLPIDRVLANEGVDPALWEAAEEAWTDRLDQDQAEEGGLQQRLDAATAAARLRYRRSVAPLDDDIDAWICFVQHLSAQPEPLPWLHQLSLSPSDVFRLQAHWSARLEAEAALQKQAQAAMVSGATPLPSLVVGAVQPVPPPAAGEGELWLQLTTDPEDAQDEDDEDDEDERAADDAEVPPLRLPLPGAQAAEPRRNPQRQAAAPFEPAARAPAPVAPAPLPLSVAPVPIAFVRGAPTDAAPPPSPWAASFSAAPLAAGAPRRPNFGSGTAPGVGPSSRPPLPFSGATRLTLERYAALLVDLERLPAAAPVLLGHHGLDAESKRREDEAWALRRTREPDLAERLRVAAEAYRATLPRMR
ncbi:MAG: hypothetical protein WKG00_25365 [Polyangiaceae bacterium]